jgi:hypothetical protein
VSSLALFTFSAIVKKSDFWEKIASGLPIDLSKDRPSEAIKGVVSEKRLSIVKLGVKLPPPVSAAGMLNEGVEKLSNVPTENDGALPISDENPPDETPADANPVDIPASTDILSKL